MGDFPDTLTVVADPSSSVPSSAHFGKKIEQLATSDPSNSSSTQNGGDGNGKSDVADAGHGASGSDTGQPHESGSITNGNDKGSANASGTSNVASKPELAVIKAKPVLYVDENGKKLGIGQISVKSDGTREIYAVNKTIPAGYALQNTSDLKNYPDKLTLVKSAASTDTSDASVVSYARTADGKIADVTSTTGDGASPTSDGKATDGTGAGAGGGDDVESGDADAGKDAKNGGTASITSTDAGKDAESKTVAPATTTTTTSTGSTEGNTSSSLPQTGNSGKETSSAVGAALLMATMTVAGIARKKL